MTNQRYSGGLVSRLVVTLLAGFIAVSAAQAQATKIFVASFGNDANDGSRGSPKRNFQAAHDAVAANGQIVVLDTAGYGTLTISKNVNVTVPPGVNGFITATSGTAVTVNPGLRVNLRGLIIESASPGAATRGIYANNVSALRLEDCTITGFGAGDQLNQTGGLVANTSIVGSIVLSDTVIRDCPGSGISHGNYDTPMNVSLVLERCRLLGNGRGMAALSSGRVTVRNSIVSNNTADGILGGGVTPNNVKVNVEYCAVTDNGTGINSFSTIEVTVSNTAITGNTTGVAGSNGNPQTYGNNQLLNNATDGTMGSVVTAK
jgi:hypothetical protein